MTLGLRFVILGAPLWHPGVHSVTLGEHLGGFLWIWSDLGAPLWYPWAPFGHPWSTLAHFLEKGGKQITNGRPTGAPNGTFFNIFLYLFYFMGVVAGAWRRLVSGCSFCNVLWEVGKRNMALTSVFTVPNAHHIFGSRHRFSEFVVPSGIHFGGCWIAFLCFWECFASSGGVRGCNTFLTPFWVHFLDSGQTRGNELSDPNGLAREEIFLFWWIRYMETLVCLIYIIISSLK